MATVSVHRLDHDRPDRVRYLLGRENWTLSELHPGPWMPDLSHPGRVIPLDEHQVIDVIILGDGFTDQEEFEEQLFKWQEDFYAVEVYDRFRGAFRIRALYTASKEPCSPLRGSFYGVPVKPHAWCRGAVSSSNWAEGGGKNVDFRKNLYDAIDEFDFNPKRYPRDLEVGDHPVIHNMLANVYSNLVVVMLVRTAGSVNTSGRTRLIADTRHPELTPPDPYWRQVNVAFGAFALHEFGHAFAYLEDEYISRRRSRADRENPASPSVFTLSNLTFSDRLGEVPWEHLSPWGDVPRYAAGDTDPSPVVGWLWRGGEDGRGVWHSEYRCLMNGGHTNYLWSTQEEPASDGQEHDLRFRHHPDETPPALPLYCLWCQEIVTLRILEKTGSLNSDDDPDDINDRGRHWYRRWIQHWRPLYWQFFDVPGQVRARENLYADPTSRPEFQNLPEDDHGRIVRIDGSDLYKPFMAGPQHYAAPPPDVTDVEWFVLTT